MVSHGADNRAVVVSTVLASETPTAKESRNLPEPNGSPKDNYGYSGPGKLW